MVVSQGIYDRIVLVVGAYKTKETIRKRLFWLFMHMSVPGTSAKVIPVALRDRRSKWSSLISWPRRLVDPISWTTDTFARAACLFGQLRKAT